MTAPTAKKPQDRRPNAEEALEQKIEQDDLLAGLPALRPPHRLRLKQRNVILRIALDLRASGISGDFDTTTPEGLEKLSTVLTAMERVDEFAESIAENPAAYARWAESKEIDNFMALLTLYTEAVGESNASSD